ncbi:Dihydrolipoyllysine-residue succinyltransferase [Ascochyta lentis]
MAESISEGTLTTLQCKTNDYVNAKDEIATIETEKIDVTVDAPESGRIVEFLIAEGDAVVVGQKIAVIETEGAGLPAPKQGKEIFAEASNRMGQHHLNKDPGVVKDQKDQISCSK